MHDEGGELVRPRKAFLRENERTVPRFPRGEPRRLFSYLDTHRNCETRRDVGLLEISV